jgi:hypothetical protein
MALDCGHAGRYICRCRWRITSASPEPGAMQLRLAHRPYRQQRRRPRHCFCWPTQWRSPILVAARPSWCQRARSSVNIARDFEKAGKPVTPSSDPCAVPPRHRKYRVSPPVTGLSLPARHSHGAEAIAPAHHEHRLATPTQLPERISLQVCSSLLQNTNKSVSARPSCIQRIVSPRSGAVPSTSILFLTGLPASRNGGTLSVMNKPFD